MTGFRPYTFSLVDHSGLTVSWNYDIRELELRRSSERMIKEIFLQLQIPPYQLIWYQVLVLYFFPADEAPQCFLETRWTFHSKWVEAQDAITRVLMMWLTKIVPNCSKSPEHLTYVKTFFFALEWYSRRSITFLVFSIRYFHHLESIFIVFQCSFA